MSSTTLGVTLGQPPRSDSVAKRLGVRRRTVDRIIKALCWVATAVGLLFLASILATLLIRGFNGLNITVFTHMTLPPGSQGGLLNAIIGSLIQTALGTAIGTPIGLMVGTYLAEYSAGSKAGRCGAVRLRTCLLSAPSILDRAVLLPGVRAAIRRVLGLGRLPGPGHAGHPDRCQNHRGHAAPDPDGPA